jgi:hypothetical protein
MLRLHQTVDKHPHNRFFINKNIINRKEYFMTETTDLLGFAVEKSPVDFADTLNQLLSQKAQERIEAHRVTLAQSIYGEDEVDDADDLDDDDAQDEFDFEDDDLDDLDDDDDDLDIDDLDDLDLEDLDLDDDNEDFTDDEDA